jgi:hypothetical protein
LGKADVAGEATGECNLQAVVVGIQASWEGLAEITSGRPRWQQGLVETCKDFSNDVKAEVGESQSVSIAESPSLIDDDSPIDEGPGKGTRPEAS